MTWFDSITKPKAGFRDKKSFSAAEKEKLLPIAETLALLDGNAFFSIEGWADQYLPEADALYQANGGDTGWAGMASFAQTKHSPV